MKIKMKMVVVALVTAAGCGGDDDSGGGFDLTFQGTSYAPHNSQSLRIQVIDKADDSIVKSDELDVGGGAVDLSWPGLLVEGHTYAVRWFVDANGNGICNEPPDDHSWSRDISAVAADVTVSHVHDVMVTPVCDTFGTHALTFTGTDFAPHNGNMLKAAIVATDSTVVARGSTTVAAGAFSIQWKSLLVAGQTYKVRFFTDLNGNGTCDAPPTDHVWEATVGSPTAAMTFNYPHDTNVTNVCTTFN